MQLDLAVDRAGCTIAVDALVSAIPACNLAKAAANAFLLVDVRNYLVIQIEVRPIGDPVEGEPAKIFKGSESFGPHPVLESLRHVLDNPVAKMHCRRANLHSAAAQQDELHGVAPA